MAVSASSFEQRRLQILGQNSSSVKSGSNNTSSSSSSISVFEQRRKQILTQTKQTKPVAIQTPIKIVSAPASPVEKARQSLVSEAKKAIKTIGDFTIKLVTPKMVSPVPETTRKQQSNVSKSIVIKPDQKKLTPEQLNPVIGKQPQQTFLKAAPKQTIWDKITAKISELFDSSQSQKARAMNAVAVKKTIKGTENISLSALSEKGGNPLKNTVMEDLTKELGIRNAPTTKEFGEVILTLALGTGLIEAPIATLKTIGTFIGLNEIKSGIISALTGKEIKLGSNKTLSDLIPNAPTDIKNLVDVVDFLATAKVSEKIVKQYPEVFQKLTKDVITKYNLPKTVTLDKQAISDIYRGLSTKEQLDAFTKLGLTSDQIATAYKKGLSIDVPSEKVVTVSDKPYWAKLKEIFKKTPTAKTTVTETSGKATVREKVVGLLGPGEKTPQEVINTVISNKLDTTPEGKEFLKTAIEAQTRGQNILISKSQPQKEIIAYHGTTKKFDNFDFELTGKSSKEAPLFGLKGSWFVDNKKVATGYAEGTGNVKEVKLDTSNYYKVDAKGKTLNDFRDELWDAKKYVKDNKKAGLIVENLIDNKDWSNTEDIGNYIFVVDKNTIKSKPSIPQEIDNLKPVLDQKLAEIQAKRKELGIGNENVITEADSSLLTGEEAKNMEISDSEYIKKVKEQLDTLTENVELQRQENESKKSILDQFTGRQIQAMRIIKRSMMALENKNGGIEDVMKLKSYNDHIYDVMKAIGTDSEQEALRYIREDLPNPIIDANTQEDLRKIEVLSSHLKLENAPGSELKPEQKPVGEGKLRESEAYKKVKYRLEETTRQDVNYNRLNLEKDVENALQFIADDPKKALNVAFGLVAPPVGQTETAISIALSDKAGRDGNYLLQSQLESSRSLRQTRRGQEIVSERGRFNDDSPHAYLKELLDRRLRNIGRSVKSDIVEGFNKLNEAKKKAVEKIDTKVKELQERIKKRDKSKIQMAQDIIDKLTCK